jgi:hypothetical protein
MNNNVLLRFKDILSVCKQGYCPQSILMATKIAITIPP